MVYAPGTKLRIPDSYGLEKLLSERMFRRLCRASNHPAFVFRLGHVMGDLQNITQKDSGRNSGRQSRIAARWPLRLQHGFHRYHRRSYPAGR